MERVMCINAKQTVYTCATVCVIYSYVQRKVAKRVYFDGPLLTTC